jgi:hypothetical protein
MNQLREAIQGGDAAGTVSAALAALRDGATPADLYLAGVQAALAHYDYETPAPRLPHGVPALNAAYYLEGWLSPEDHRLGVVQGLAYLAQDRAEYLRGIQAEPRIPGDISVAALRRELLAAAETGDLAGADGALLALVQMGAPRPVIYGTLLEAAAGDLGGFGHELIAGQHFVEVADVLPDADLFAALRPALHFATAFGDHAAARQSLAFAAEAGLRDLAARHTDDPSPAAVRAWAERFLSAAPLATVAALLREGVGLRGILNAIVVAAAETLMQGSGTRRREVHNLTYTHAARRAVQLVGPHDPIAVLFVLQAARFVAGFAPPRSLVSLDGATPKPEQLAARVVRQASRHGFKAVEAALVEADEVGPDLAPYLYRAAAAFLDAVGGETTVLAAFESPGLAY